MNRTKWVVFVFLSVLLAGGICLGNDWPQFRGPNRDGLLCEGTPPATGIPISNSESSICTDPTDAITG